MRKVTRSGISQFTIESDATSCDPTGKTETKSDSLKSLMAVYLFRKKITDYTAQGVNFKEHLYVP